MIVLGRNIYVQEIKKDIKVDGILQKYDDSSDFIFAKIIEVGDDLLSIPYLQDKDNTILVLRRISKSPFYDGYFIKFDDILATMTLEEFNAL